MTKNSAEKRAARAYLAENPNLTYHQALQHVRKIQAHKVSRDDYVSYSDPLHTNPHSHISHPHTPHPHPHLPELEPEES